MMGSHRKSLPYAELFRRRLQIVRTRWFDDRHLRPRFRGYYLHLRVSVTRRADHALRIGELFTQFFLLFALIDARDAITCWWRGRRGRLLGNSRPDSNGGRNKYE